MGIIAVLYVYKGLEVGYRRRCIAKVNDDLCFRSGEVTLLLGSKGQVKQPHKFMEILAVLYGYKGLEIGYRRCCIAKLNDDLCFRSGEVTVLLGSNGQVKQPAYL